QQLLAPVQQLPVPVQQPPARLQQVSQMPILWHY
ncbi:unnamed protein product, partial [Rotaria magnacalcarata]